MAETSAMKQRGNNIGAITKAIVSGNTTANKTLLSTTTIINESLLGGNANAGATITQRQQRLSYQQYQQQRRRQHQQQHKQLLYIQQQQHFASNGNQATKKVTKAKQQLRQHTPILRQDLSSMPKQSAVVSLSQLPLIPITATESESSSYGIKFVAPLSKKTTKNSQIDDMSIVKCNTRIPLQPLQKHESHTSDSTQMSITTKRKTSFLNDMYEKDLLSHTSYRGSAGMKILKKSHAQQSAPKHQLPIPLPQSSLPHPLQSLEGHLHSTSFQYNDEYVQPMISNSAQIDFSVVESTRNSEPLNHVYETIKERSPLSHTPQRSNKQAPPLPPARQVKKQCAMPIKSEYNTVTSRTPYNSFKLTEARTLGDGEQNSHSYQCMKEQQHKPQLLPHLPHRQHYFEQTLFAKLKPAEQLQHLQKLEQHTLDLPTSSKSQLSTYVAATTNISNAPTRLHPVVEVNNSTPEYNTKSTDTINSPNRISKVNSLAQMVHQIDHVQLSILNKQQQHEHTINSNCVSPIVLPIAFEEASGDYQDVHVLEEKGTTAQLPYRYGKIEVRLETAQAMAAAAYYARAAQKLAQSASTINATTKRQSTEMSSSSTTRNGGFCGALQRAPPPMPPGLSRRLANKENFGIGKVKVMLRISDAHTGPGHSHFMAVDKKKRQVTLIDQTNNVINSVPSSQERGPMVSAPKLFAFDSLFTAEDQQADVCASALCEVIPAVLEGSDGCMLTIGYPSCGQTKTMLGSVHLPTELGAIPCAITWLYKGINERRQRSGARFSVRVSALGVSATKPDSSSKDLLAAHATESDDSPGVYLRDDFLGGPTELRAPTAERAALFLDAALAARQQSGLEPAMIFTLHVYQYSLSRKGGVAGGRSRLHLIDLGGCANRNGGLPLSSIGNILLALLSGQRHPPNKDHPLTPLLKDCLAPLTCHVAIMAHVTYAQSHTDALTTIQLASRIHRMRRRKHRFPISGGDKSSTGLTCGMNGHQSTGSSAGSGADPSSSELSADTVIYMGPSDDATDGEHPPVYLPSLSSGDNRGVMSKALRGTGLEKLQHSTQQTKLATLSTAATPTTTKKTGTHKAPQSPVIARQTCSIKRSHINSPTPQQTTTTQSILTGSISDTQHHGSTLSGNSAKGTAGISRHPGLTMMCSKGSNVPSPKSSPLRRSGMGAGGNNVLPSSTEPGDSSVSPLRKVTEEQWIDGPRVSRAKVAEARHLLREVNHVKQCETWVDGPKSQSSRSLTAGNLPIAPSQVQGYGFMDQHKKSMIRQWVENQTSQVFQSTSVASSPTHISSQPHHRDQQAQHLRSITYHMSQLKQKSLDAYDEIYAGSNRPSQKTLHCHPTSSSLHGSQIHLVHPTEVLDQLSTELVLNTQLRHTSHNVANTRDETDMQSTHSLHTYTGHDTILTTMATMSPSDTGTHHTTNITTTILGEQDEDQDSGPSEVPPALPLIEPHGSREISHESLHRILSRPHSRESLLQLQQQQEDPTDTTRSSSHYAQHMSDCGLQVTEEEIARTMATEHPLSALSHCENMSVVSSFNIAGDAFSDCAIGERTRNQFDQLARLREIFTSQLAMAEVTPVFRNGYDMGSVYSEPAFRFNTGAESVCSEPIYRPPSPRQPSRSPSQCSLPSLNGIMQIAGMEQYASLRHPDGASDPNLPKIEEPFAIAHDDICEVDEKSALLSSAKQISLEQENDTTPKGLLSHQSTTLPTSTSSNHQKQLPLLPLNNTASEAYDSGHDSSTPRTSKHSGISRRAESGYHSVATARDSDESSFTSGLSKEHQHHNRITLPKKRRQDKGLCNWLMNPFTCTYPETEGEISDF